MLHILLLILKIIGIIILAILGIAVLLLAVVLFVPVRYRFQAETPGGLEKLKLDGKATWLFYVVAAYVSYSDKKLDWRVRMLWRNFRMGDKSEAESEIDDKKDDEFEAEAHKPGDVEANTTGGNASEVNACDEKTIEDCKTEEDPHHQDARKQSKKIRKSKKQSIFDKIRYTISNICDKIKKILEAKDKIIEFISDEIHQAAFGRVTKEVFALVRYLRPKKLKGYVHFGLKEPYDTGRILAVFSVLYPFYGGKIQIEPEFEREVLEGRLTIQGRAHLYPFVITICRLFFDKNVMTAYKNFRRK